MEGQTVVCLAIGQTPRLLLSLEEEHLAKPEAKEIVRYMQQEMKIKVAMITGDNKHAALRVATHLNIPHELVTFKANPGKKRHVVKSF
jgi:P-type E1-E2 ATPase